LFFITMLETRDFSVVLFYFYFVSLAIFASDLYELIFQFKILNCN
jgi:hypothetical protein